MNEDCPSAHQQQANANVDHRPEKDAMTASLDSPVSAVSTDSAASRHEERPEETSRSSPMMCADDLNRTAIAVLFPGALPAPCTHVQTSAVMPYSVLLPADTQCPLGAAQGTNSSPDRKRSSTKHVRSSSLDNAFVNSSHEDFAAKGRRRSSIGDDSVPSLAELEPEPGEDRPSSPLYSTWPGDMFLDHEVRQIQRPLSASDLLCSQSEEGSGSNPASSLSNRSRSMCSSPVRLERRRSQEVKFDVSSANRMPKGAGSSAEGFFVPIEESTSEDRRRNIPSEAEEAAAVTRAEHMKTYYDVLRELQTTDRQLVHLDLGTPTPLLPQSNGSV